MSPFIPESNLVKFSNENYFIQDCKILSIHMHFNTKDLHYSRHLTEKSHRTHKVQIKTINNTRSFDIAVWNTPEVANQHTNIPDTIITTAHTIVIVNTVKVRRITWNWHKITRMGNKIIERSRSFLVLPENFYLSLVATVMSYFKQFHVKTAQTPECVREMSVLLKSFKSPSFPLLEQGFQRRTEF